MLNQAAHGKAKTRAKAFLAYVESDTFADD